MLSRLFTTLCLGVLCAFALPSDDIYDQKGYYLFPIRPGELNYLSGSMGELRNTHFHSGIDIKTGGVQGYNVYATADGFLSRVKVSAGGYGNALYIQHPNHTFSVYAHLRDFSAAVTDYVLKQQYRKRSFEVDLFPKKGSFNFHKGDIIAASGNSGSSQGPHLHFEIRDKYNRVLDPLRFEFSEIRDTRVPEVRSVAFKAMDIAARVNGQFGRFDFDVIRKGNTFQLREKVSLRGNIGIELYAFDRQNGTNNRYGVPCVELYHNKELIHSYHIKAFAFKDTRNLLVHTNYGHMINTRRRFHKLYVDDGNEMPFYNTDRSGLIHIADTLPHQFQIKLWDVYGNFSETNFVVNEGGPESKSIRKWREKENYRVMDNTLEIHFPVQDSTINHLTVYSNRFRYEIEPAYTTAQDAFYLWNLKDGLPDSIDYCGHVVSCNFKSMIPPNTEFSYFSNKMNIEFGKKALFDTLYLQTSWKIDETGNREIFSFHHRSVPLRKSVKVLLKPEPDYGIEKKQRAVYAINTSGGLRYYGGKWLNDEIVFFTRELISYTIATDSVAPLITPVRVNRDELKFIIKDKLSGIASYNAYVNGEWVLMKYESKRSLIWSEKLNKNKPFAGRLVLRVEDKAGNESVYQSEI